MTDTETDTNGLNEQLVFEIKEKFYSGWGVGMIADELNLTTQQVFIAVNQNEVNPPLFTKNDFAL